MTEDDMVMLNEMFREKNYFQRLRDMLVGLRKPKDTREYKAAVIELQRQKAPLFSILIPVVLVGLLMLFGGSKKTVEADVEVQIEQNVEEVQPLEEVEPMEQRVVEDFTPVEMNFSRDVVVTVDAPTPVSAEPVSAQPASVDSVLQIKSPVILRGIFGVTRNAGTRGAALQKYGGNAATEAAVLRALRWLKQNQQADGSWRNNKTAMTGLAILTYLAHGEKPGDSPEFGETVQKALEYLITTYDAGKGTWTVHDGNNYSHLIATYALCEAYGMTMNPNVRQVADSALEVIIKGQNKWGGWDYKMNPESNRNDLSYTGWAVQALHAAEMANFYHDPEAFIRCYKKSIKGILHNGYPDGGFGYTGPQKGGLTGVGTLCLQFLAAEFDKSQIERTYVKNSLENIIYKWAPEWVGATPENPEQRKATDVQKDPNVVNGSCPQYYYYYAGQSIFQDGQKWDAWNKRMWPSYVKAQLIKNKDESGYVDHEGNAQETGHWMNFDVHTDRPVMDTCLAALQLMVYYRYLPTFRKVEVPGEVIISETPKDDGDIEVICDI